MDAFGFMVNWRNWKRTRVLDGGVTVSEEGSVLTVEGNPSTMKLKKITVSQGGTVIRSIIFAAPGSGATVENPDYKDMVIG